MKEFTSILPLDHGTLDRYFLKSCSEVYVTHIRINEVLSIFFQKCMLCYGVQKIFRTSPDYACTEQNV